jgi:hypothetical protein
MKSIVPMIIAIAIGLFFAWKTAKLQQEVFTLRSALQESISLNDEHHVYSPNYMAIMMTALVSLTRV